MYENNLNWKRKDNKKVYAILLVFLIIIAWLVTINYQGTIMLILALFFWAILLRFDIVIAFMYSITFALNIGNYLYVGVFGLQNSFNYQDVFIILSYLVLLAPSLRKHISLNDKFIVRMFGILFLFSFYQVFVSNFIKVDLPAFHKIRFLFHHRFRILGAYIFIPTYYIIKYDSKKVLDVLALVTLLVTFVFFISFVTGIPLISISKLNRGFIQGAVQRAYLHKTGFLALTSFIAILLIVVRRKISYSRQLIIAGILFTFMLIMSISRLEIVNHFATIMIVLYLANKYLRINISRIIRSTSPWIVILSLASFILFNQYFITLFGVVKLTIMEAFGIIEVGTTQTRSLYELQNIMPTIKENLFFGAGFQKKLYSATVGGRYAKEIQYGLTDIPFFTNLAIYGIIGLSFYFLMFNSIIRRLIKVLRLISRNIKFAYSNCFIEIITLTAIGAIFIDNITFQLFYITYDLSILDGRILTGFYLGMFLSLAKIIEEKFSQRNLDSIIMPK